MNTLIIQPLVSKIYTHIHLRVYFIIIVINKLINSKCRIFSVSNRGINISRKIKSNQVLSLFGDVAAF